MNQTDRRILAAAAIVLLSMTYLLYDDSFISNSKNFQSGPSIGKVTVLENDVRRKVSSQFHWQTAHEQDQLHIGDSIFTGKNSTMLIELKDGSTLTVPENSMILFSKAGEQLSLNIQAGRLAGNLHGCVKVNLKGENKDVCAESNSVVEMDSSGSIATKKISQASHRQSKSSGDRGTASVGLQTLEPIFWTQKLDTNIYHFKNNHSLKASWKSNKSYGRYHFQVSKDTEFQDLVLDEKVQSKNITVKKYPYHGKYYVRVLAEDLDGNPAAASPAEKVEFIELTPPTVLAPLAGENFVLRRNANGEILDSNQIKIEWDYILPQAQFDLQISRSETFDQLVFQSLQTKGLSLETSSLKEGNYFVRVRDSQIARDDSWSKPSSFSVKLGELPQLQAPQILTDDFEYLAPSKEDLTLQWQPVESAKKYKITVADNPEFSGAQDYFSEKPRWVVENYKYGKHYFKVVAETEKGFSGAPSAMGSYRVRFKTPVLTPAPNLDILGKSPDDMGEPQNLHVEWTDLKKVNGYLIQISDNPKFKNRTEVKTSGPSGEITLPKPGNYFWRVRALGDEERPISAFSPTGQVSYTLRVPLSTPELTEPMDQLSVYFQKNTTPYIWFTWKNVRQATDYSLEIATDPEFTNKVLQANTSSSRFLLKETLPQADLYWRIQARGDDNRISNWSPVRKLTIMSGRSPAQFRGSSK